MVGILELPGRKERGRLKSKVMDTVKEDMCIRVGGR